MSQENSTTEASEENQPGSGEPTAGGSTEGAPEAQAPGADAFAVERESLAKQARDFQAAADRERAAREKAEQKLAAATQGKDPEAPKPFTMEDFLRLRELDTAASSLKEKFPDAEESLFSRSHEFDSPEAFESTVERSHTARKAYKDKVNRDADERFRELARERGLTVDDPAPPSGGGGSTGDPTPTELANTPTSEWEARGWSDEVVDRVLAANSTDGLLRMGAED